MIIVAKNGDKAFDTDTGNCYGIYQSISSTETEEWKISINDYIFGSYDNLEICSQDFSKMIRELKGSSKLFVLGKD